MSRLLIVGSLEGELGAAARVAIARGAKLAHAEGVAAGLGRLRSEGADLALVDLRHDVAWLVGALHAERIACPVVACGHAEDADAAVRAIEAGARDFLPLPPDADLIVAMLEAAGAEPPPEGPIARDPAMLTLLARATQLARAEASLLITGESGTGKEVLARHIHALSGRARGPFVALNCAALPETLLESELFGHEKGAFSGAVASRKGKFEQADGGTLLLDEIGEMDPRLQAKILRVIQEREVDRLGGTAPVRVDVRLLAATHRDLTAEVSRGRFREDLYFRLNVLALHIPPLRGRPADILPLAEHFGARYARANGLPQRGFSPQARAALLAHPWPGNVRELENCVHRAVLLADGAEIGLDAIELTQPRQPEAPVGAPAPQPSPALRITGLVGRKVEEVEQELILETLTHCLGNRTRAAEILGISIRTLRNKLQEYRAAGIAVPPAPGQAPIALPFG
ncbi:sigma-54 dependent transcriptional regulator [Roseomonas sp. AR75]|uniref:sigma-54-dependent transcriptional regulator n=1 Tax=Roseomonas sp. AR75 TaxID=2562311 RepID=UPI0010C10E13|nr:sigma-54 dependent transcriptional regulator [Roseomonas sp. AR75]